MQINEQLRAVIILFYCNEFGLLSLSVYLHRLLCPLIFLVMRLEDTITPPKSLWIRYPWGRIPLTLLWTDVCKYSHHVFTVCQLWQADSVRGIVTLWNSFLDTYKSTMTSHERQILLFSLFSHQKFATMWICGFSSSERIDIYKFSSNKWGSNKQ